MIKHTTSIPFCATVGKTCFDNVTPIINMNLKMKYNYTEKYSTKVCSAEAKNFLM